MQLFTGLEAHRLARSNAHFRPGPGVPPDPRFPGTNIKDAEPAQLNPLPFRERAFQGLEHRIDCSLSLVPLQAGALNHLVNDVLFYQGFPPSGQVFVSSLILEIFAAIVNAARLP
jgi:hypothetical protein